jgi:hypothetical protein
MECRRWSEAVGDGVRTDAEDEVHLVRLLCLHEAIAVVIPIVDQQAGRDLSRAHQAQMTFDSDCADVLGVNARRDRLDTAIRDCRRCGVHPSCRRLGCRRGVATLTGCASPWRGDLLSATPTSGGCWSRQPATLRPLINIQMLML